MKTRLKLFSLITLSLIFVLSVGYGIYAIAGQEGTSSDPLVTKSYIDKVFQPQVEKLIDQAATEAAAAESDDLDALYLKYKNELNAIVNEFNVSTGNALKSDAYVALLQQAINNRLLSIEVTQQSETDVFRTVKVLKGKTVTLTNGAELFLRTGSATNGTELLNVPAGTAVAAETALKSNTLYIATTDKTAIKATSDAEFFIRGAYTTN